MESVINSLEVKLALLSNAREKDLFVLLLKSYAGSSFKDTRKFQNVDRGVLVTFQKCLPPQLSPVLIHSQEYGSQSSEIWGRGLSFDSANLRSRFSRRIQADDLETADFSLVR